MSLKRDRLAERLVTYSDTVVAFALVNGLAFLITLGEPDIRCSIADVVAVAFAGNLLLPVAATWALIWMRGQARRLELDAEEPEDPVVDRFWRVLFRVRVTLIWVFAAIVMFGLVGATRDPRCLVEGALP